MILSYYQMNKVFIWLLLHLEDLKPFYLLFVLFKVYFSAASPFHSIISYRSGYGDGCALSESSWRRCCRQKWSPYGVGTFFFKYLFNISLNTILCLWRRCYGKVSRRGCYFFNTCPIFLWIQILYFWRSDKYFSE